MAELTLALSSYSGSQLLRMTSSNVIGNTLVLLALEITILASEEQSRLYVSGEYVQL